MNSKFIYIGLLIISWNMSILFITNSRTSEILNRMDEQHQEMQQLLEQAHEQQIFEDNLKQETKIK